MLQVLARVGRFSCFEAGEFRGVAATLKPIKRDGLTRFNPEKFGYPWTAVELTEAGRRLIESAP